MRAIIEIILAIFFTVVSGTTVIKLSCKAIKKEAILKVHNGLPSLENFTQKMTRQVYEYLLTFLFKKFFETFILTL